MAIDKISCEQASSSFYGTAEQIAEYEDIKSRIANWRWSHDAAWLRLVTRYVELRSMLHKSNDLLVFGTQMNGGYMFSNLGSRVVRDWICQ
jgi:hypothetical protein